MRKPKYSQDELLESYLIYWYNKVANVHYEFHIPERALRKFIKVKKSIPIHDLVMMHSRYREWERYYIEMEIEWCHELHLGYVKRMNEKKTMLGNEIVQRFILESMSKGIEYEYDQTVEWYEKDDDHFWFVVIVIIILFLFAILSF